MRPPLHFMGALERQRPAPGPGGEVGSYCAQQGREQGQDQDQRARRDAVVAEQLEVVVGDEAQQPRDRRVGDDQGHEGRYQKQRELIGHDQLIAEGPVELVQGSRAQSRDEQVEREGRGRHPIQPGQQAAHDRGPGARDAGDQGRHLGQPDHEGLAGRDLGEDVHAAGTIAALDQQEDDPAHDQRHRDDQRRGARIGGRHEGIELLFDQQADHRRREERDEDVEPEALNGPVGGKLAGLAEEIAGVIGQHRHHRANLDEDVEREAVGFRRKSQQGRGHQQVAGRGDGQKLGQPLDDAQDNRIK